VAKHKCGRKVTNVFLRVSVVKRFFLRSGNWEPIRYTLQIMVRLSSFLFLLFSALLFSTITIAQEKDSPMTHHARGTFTVDVKPLTPPPAEGIGRFSIDKQIHGDLEATTKGEMFSAGDPKTGMAGYVAIEVVTGVLAGKKGSFALQQSATMDTSGRKLSVVVVPGSGTGELKGIAGTFDIQIANGQHSYDLEYTLP
jgi:hypothetical protein